jgi:hypothetical protein|uniref:Uncharacterized protein n=1 Tax=Thermogladius calderae TaxID=1200300 RepID=A0A7J3Y0N0_9CREN
MRLEEEGEEPVEKEESPAEETVEEEGEEVEVTPSKIALLEQLVDLTRKWEKVIAGEESLDVLKATPSIPVVKQVKKKPGRRKKATTAKKSRKGKKTKSKSRSRRKGGKS